MVTEQGIQKLKDKYLGCKVFVLTTNERCPFSERGIVTEVDDMGRLHGTWGDLAIIPGEDYIEFL